MAISPSPGLWHADPAALQSLRSRIVLFFFACICDRGIGRESQTEKISDEKKMQKEKRPDEC